MAGLWDQIGGFLSNVGDVGQKIADVGETFSTAWGTLATLKSGSAAATPPFLPSSLPPGYGPLIVGPSGNAVNTSSMGAQAIQDRIASRANEKTWGLVAVALLGVYLLQGK